MKVVPWPVDEGVTVCQRCWRHSLFARIAAHQMARQLRERLCLQLRAARDVRSSRVEFHGREEVTGVITGQLSLGANDIMTLDHGIAGLWRILAARRGKLPASCGVQSKTLGWMNWMQRETGGRRGDACTPEHPRARRSSAAWEWSAGFTGWPCYLEIRAVDRLLSADQLIARLPLKEPDVTCAVI